MIDREVLSRFIRESGLKPRQTTKSWVFECPKCRKADKLYIRKGDGRFVCWFCKEVDGYQGKGEYALSDLTGLSLKEVRARLGIGGDPQVSLFLDARLIDFFGDDEEVDEDAAELPTFQWPFDYLDIDDPGAQRGASYMEGRGVSVELSKEYGVKYSPEERRVIFPVQQAGCLYGWQGRLVVPHIVTDASGRQRDLLKVKSSSGIPRERVVMFADRLAGSEHAVLTEGPFDGLKAHLCGGNVVAMGKAVSTGQVSAILRSGIKRLYLALDPDAAAETERLARTYFDDVELFEMVAHSAVGGSKPDLGAMEPGEVLDLFRGARQIQAGRLFFWLDPAVTRRA